MVDRSKQQSSGRRLGFGYEEGLPAGVVAAWGCRAIAYQEGAVDVVHDRQSAYGKPAALDALCDKLNGGLMQKWKTKAIELLASRKMMTSEPQEFTLLDEDGVVVKANTRGSYGYLYVCAYTA